MPRMIGGPATPQTQDERPPIGGQQGEGNDPGPKETPKAKVPRWLSVTVTLASVALGLLGGHLVIRWGLNARFLDSYRNGSYNAGVPNTLTYLNWPCPHLPFHNLGCAAYRLGSYDVAEAAFVAELGENPPHENFPDAECDARVDAALSVVRPLDVDRFSTEQEKQYLIEELTIARGYLTEEGCANPERNAHDGHSEDAETLKREIDEALDRLNDPNNDGSGSDSQDNQDDQQDNQQQQQQQGDGEQSPEQEQELNDKLSKRRSDAAKDRSKEQRDSGGSGNGSEAGGGADGQGDQQGDQGGGGGGPSTGASGGNGNENGEGGYRGKTW